MARNKASGTQVDRLSAPAAASGRARGGSVRARPRSGAASRAATPPSAQQLAMYRAMLVTRAVDERMWLLQRQGAIAFTVPCKGHEAAQVGAAFAFDARRDWFYPYYRDAGFMIGLGMSPLDIFLGGFGRLADPSSGGRQMPYHFSWARAHVVSGSSPVATQVPHAAGTGLALRLRGEKAAVYCSFGEGATSKGDFHEGVNLAAVRRLPVVFLCQNNHYAISVPTEKQMPVRSVAERAAAYGIPGESVDGNDVLAVYETVGRAVRRALAGEGPTLVEARTYRLMAHSSGDDDRNYRTRDEIAEWAQKDPITRFRDHLLASGELDEAADQALRDEVSELVDQQTEAAEQSPAPGPEDAMRFVYAETEGVDGHGR